MIGSSDRRWGCKILILCLVLGSMVFPISGCGDTTAEFTEFKALNEKVTEAELNKFLRVVRRLPDQQIPPYPSVFAPPPEWNASRTLPVNELVDEEQKQLLERWDVSWQAVHQQRNPHLVRALRREDLTHEQFMGLLLAIGVAYSRTMVEESHDLNETVNRGEDILANLKQNKQAFHQLTPETRYQILHQAIWLCRVDRARHLLLVPPENLALVNEHREELQDVLPAEFRTDPFADVTDVLDELGMPFEDLPDGFSDESISWSPNDRALIGRDEPDPEFAEDRRQAGLPSSRRATKSALSP